VDEQTTEKRSLARRLGPAGVLGVVWAILPGVAGFYLLSQIGPVSEWLQSRESAGLAAYVAAFILTAGLGLLPTYAQAVLGGWVFGFALGFPAALLGFTGAAVLGYGVSRLVSQDRVEQVITENVKAAAVHRALIGKGFWRTLGIVTLLRVSPNSPFAIMNLVMAASGVRVLPYVLGTMIGMAPRTAVAAFFAAAAGKQAKDIQTFITEGPGTLILIIGIVTMLAVLAIIGLIANKAIERVMNLNNPAGTD
jgi:uncharacterized membrane protein YdjX (TVP38/TMEM64 family)